LIGKAYRVHTVFRLDDRSVHHQVMVVNRTMENTMFKTGLFAVALMMMASVLSAPASAGRCIGPHDSAKDFFADQMMCQ
jgi:hypothetical protein